MKKIIARIAIAGIAGSAIALGGASVASAAPGDHFANPGMRSFCKSIKGTNNEALLNFNAAAARLAEKC